MDTKNAAPAAGAPEKQEEGIVLDEQAPETADETVDAETAAQQGLTPDEIEAGKRQGLIVDKKPTAAAAPAAPAAEGAQGAQAAPAEMTDAAKVDVMKVVGKDLDGPTEHTVVAKLDKVSQAYYWAAKADRKKRQNIEIERDHLTTKNKVLQDQIDALRAQAKGAGKQGDDIDNILGGEPAPAEGADKEKPLTRKELEAMEAEKTEQQRAQAERAAMLSNKLAEHDAQARAEYADYDQTIDLAVDLIQRVDTLLAESPKKAARAKQLYNEWRATCARSLELAGPLTAADLAYELGKMHPDYGTKAEKADTAGTGEGAGTLSEEKLKKAEQNLRKAPSSASVGAGGRFIPYSQLTAEQVAGMGREEYAKLPREVREKFLT